MPRKLFEKGVCVIATKKIIRKKARCFYAAKVLDANKTKIVKLRRPEI